MRDERPRRLARRTLFGLTALGLTVPALRLGSARAAEADHDPVMVYLPRDIYEGERWIAISIGHQAAVGMVGHEAVRLAWATTGKDGWETPEGQFRVNRRVYNETMTSAAIGIPPGPDSYHLTDVLYTQYFTWDGHALHLNYWRPEHVFGRERTSHGCIGLRYNDAHFFWQHLTHGSRVVIHA
jgi:lipoprotein-anchoring transpeptidase ErfK/SrfK